MPCSLVPSFAPYSGLFSVGTKEFEVPINELVSNNDPGPDPLISTISFRIFYPCQEMKKNANVYWLPSPQTTYFKAYAEFLQAKPWMATFFAYFPLTRLIFHTTIPAHRDAPLLPASHIDSDRWPVLIFSHGLGGSKNAYSYICGSLASYGMIVVAPEHRDGSAPISIIRKTATTEARSVLYRQVGNKGVEKVADGKRDVMLRIRCWELGLLHNCVMKLDAGEKLTNLAADKSPSEPTFTASMDVHSPGRIAWAGHSFGTASVVQFVKSVYQRSNVLLPVSATSESLFAQVVPASPLICLDLWALPLQSPDTASLLSRNLPCYDSMENTRNPPLAILSQAFYDWPGNRDSTISVLSARSQLKPLMFYVSHSAHLSQSDFGPLFPWLTRRALGAEEPERTMGLNVWAIVEYLRRCGTTDSPWKRLKPFKRAVVGSQDVQDDEILEGKRVRGWIVVPGTEAKSTEVLPLESDSGYVSENKEGTTETPVP